MSESKGKIYRSLSVITDLTEKKKAIILDILKSYRKTAEKIAKYQWNLFFKTGRIDKFAKLKEIETDLINKYKPEINYNVVFPSLRGFINSIKKNFEKIVRNSSLSEKDKRILLYLNKREEWFINKTEKVKVDVTDYHRKIARKIFKHLFYKFKKPSFKKVPLIVGEKTSSIEKPKKSKHFDLWIKLSTKEKGKRISIPVKLYDYFNKRGGEIRRKICITEDLKIFLLKEIEKKNIDLSGEISLDFGISNFITTDKGDIFGKKFYKKVEKYSDKIIKLLSNLNKKRIKPTSSKRYKRLVTKVRRFIKCEIRRIINRIVNLYKPKRIIVEDIKGLKEKLLRKFSKKLRRILQFFNFSFLERKLKEISEEYDIEIIYVNPAYTSQICSNCGYIDEKNRNKEKFECKLCGKKMHADVNAARNLLSRARMEWQPKYTKQYIIIQVTEFLQNLNSNTFRYLRNKAISKINENPLIQFSFNYQKDFSSKEKLYSSSIISSGLDEVPL